jgi:hypothetical protein
MKIERVYKIEINIITNSIKLKPVQERFNESLSKGFSKVDSYPGKNCSIYCKNIAVARVVANQVRMDWLSEAEKAVEILTKMKF